MNQPDQLPAPPEPTLEDVPGELWGQNVIYPALFRADQMRSYALTAVKAEREHAERMHKAYQTAHARAMENGSKALAERARADALEAALKELVECKALKDRIDTWGPQSASDAVAFWAAKDDYERRKPLAWSAARSLIEPTKGST